MECLQVLRYMINSHPDEKRPVKIYESSVTIVIADYNCIQYYKPQFCKEPNTRILEDLYIDLM